jgi:superfamily II DNA or RNA helicase
VLPPEFLPALREEAKPGLWSSGVTLSRSGAIAVESSTHKETVLRVKAPGRTVPLTVVLYPEDLAWECDCPGKVDPCEHVVAAALFLQQAAQSAQPRWSRVAYHFGRVEGGLILRRMLAHPDGTETPLEGSLAALLAKPGEAQKLQVEQCDLIVDRLLERPLRGPLPPERLDALLTALKPARSVLLDGEPVAVSSETLPPLARVEDQGEEIVVRLERDPRLLEVVSAGVGLAAGALVKLGETALPSTQRYRPDQLAELSARVLPELARRFRVEVKSRRLPPIDRELKPRIQLELTQLDQGMSLFPTLVYGAPAHARVDGGRLVFLQGAVPLRDEAAEQSLTQSLREQLDLIPGRRVTVQGADIGRWVEKLRRWRGGLSGDAARILGPEVTLRPRLEVRSLPSKDGAPQVALDLSFDTGGSIGPNVPAAAVLRAWSEGLGLVPLEGGGWAALPEDWLQQHGQVVLDLLAARREDGQLANHALPQLGALCEALEQPPPPGLDRLAPLLEGFEHLPAPQLPPDLTGALRDYQRTGVAWLRFLREAGLGGVLADDMGLGKTLQTLCVLGPRSLVVCPTSVLPNWAAELTRFRPGLRVCTYHGPGRTLDPAADVTLTSFALLRLDAAVLSAATWNTVVLDEAQAIKNPESQVAQAAFGLRADFRVALSGTPLENRLEELWSLMHFTNPGLLGGRRQFEERVARMVAEGQPGAAQALRRRIRPFLLRRVKAEVAPELPLRSESVLHVSLDERERALYDSVLAATRPQVLSLLREGGNVLRALEALLRLRQAACHAGLLPGQHLRTSSKVKTLLEALGTAAADGHKALVFSQWTSLLDLLEPELEAAGLPFVRLDGSTRDRGEVTARFQSADGPPVMLISLKAGGTGLNLTAADHVFLVDPWWNPAVEAQAADRAHRIGQERPVMIYRLVSQGTVEERILRLQDSKRALFEAALGDAAAAATLSREDLLSLFE